MKHGMENALIIVSPRVGEHNIRSEDVIAKIYEAGASLATVMMPGIAYKTGQVFILIQITMVICNNQIKAKQDIYSKR